MSQQQQQQVLKKCYRKKPILPAIKKSKRIEILRERKLKAGVQIKTTTKVTRTAVKYLPADPILESVSGRPLQTPYKDLNFRKVVSGGKHWAWCLFCNRRLKNVARKRLITHRNTCQNNGPATNKRYLKNLKMLHENQIEPKEARDSETDDADERDELNAAREKREETIVDNEAFWSTFNVSFDVLNKMFLVFADINNINIAIFYENIGIQIQTDNTLILIEILNFKKFK